ncbi:papilin-like [Acanthaster planci]|uniref:Papilin-like n=1 Tax=Acanthaster planci TaxID=133434 RepID=A0A8B7Y615_ACAPL|nr:papilin-like [Acanthaster planci]
MKFFRLVLFVTFIAVWVVSGGHVGQCPAIDGSSRGTCVELCSSDSDCMSHQKCCSNGCGHVCTTVKQPRIGHKPPLQCPPIDSGTVGICTEECSSDDQCKAGKICCSNGCGHACVEPVEPPGKSGKCPAVDERRDSEDNCTDDCGVDADCENDLKCCRIGCNHSCVEPVRDANVTKPGVCPQKPPESFGICSESCDFDGDCPENQKCCSNGCGHACMSPAPSKLGQCPKVSGGQIGVCSEDCQSDADCPDQQRCCSNGCGHSCMDTTQSKPGECPKVPDGLAGICWEGCSSDMDCEGVGKCCSNGCGHVCVDPVVVVTQPPERHCPLVKGDTVGICVDECSSDSDCEAAQKCCSNGCGHVCMDADTTATAQGCRLGENYYTNGEMVPTSEDCQACHCEEGEVRCSDLEFCGRGVFNKALVMPLVLSAAGVLLSLALVILIVRCFLIRAASKRSRYKLMHEVPEFEPIPGASTRNAL